VYESLPPPNAPIALSHLVSSLPRHGGAVNQGKHLEFSLCHILIDKNRTFVLIYLCSNTFLAEVPFVAIGDYGAGEMGAGGSFAGAGLDHGYVGVS
jgi:hypothetical protein